MNTQVDSPDHQQIVAIIREVLPDAKVILFGSRARGDFYADSDYDLAIISPSIIEKRAVYSQLSQALHQHVDAPFDILLYTPQEYEKGKNGFLPELIEQEGVLLSSKQ